MNFYLKFIFYLLEVAHYIVFLKSVFHPTSHIGYIGLLMPNNYKFYEVISFQEQQQQKRANWLYPGDGLWGWDVVCICLSYRLGESKCILICMEMSNPY